MRQLFLRLNTVYFLLSGYLNAQTALHNLFPADSAACYRIPALVTAPNGHLLAAIDQRVPHCGDLKDNPDINIVLRSSSDDGASWSPVRTVAGFPAGQSASDPSLIVDEQSGTVLLLYNYMDLNTAPGVFRFHLMTSADNGQTWSVPRDITEQLTRPEWRSDFMFITSGGGIQTRSGELLHCLVNLQRGVFVIGSRDHGQNWFLIEHPVQPADESKIVELADGSWMINARVNGAGLRYVHTSPDRGNTWITRADSALVDPGCNAGFIRYQGNTLLFSYVNHARSRTHLCVRLSPDSGKTWLPPQTVYPGAAAYSALTVLKNGDIGLIFENDNYKRVCFMSFPVTWPGGKRNRP